MKEIDSASSLNRNIIDFHDDAMDVIVYWSRMVYSDCESLKKDNATHTFYELHYVTEGSLDMRLIEGKSVCVQKDAFIIIPPHVSHGVPSYEPNTAKFVMGFSLESNQYEITKAMQAIELLNVIAVPQDVAACVQLMQNVSTENNALANEQLKSLTRFLLLALLSAESNFAGLQDSEWYNKNRKHDTKTSVGEMILAYIKAHPVGLSVQELAEHFYFSTRHVNRVLTESFGKTAIQLLQEEKILYIKKLITTTDLTEADIAEMCHFSNSSSMNRFFRKFEKSSVSRFKKDINL